MSEINKDVIDRLRGLVKNYAKPTVFLYGTPIDRVSVRSDSVSFLNEKQKEQLFYDCVANLEILLLNK